MPKKEQLESNIFITSPDSDDFKKYSCWMAWEERYLHRKGLYKKIDLSTVISWTVEPGPTGTLARRRKLPPGRVLNLRLFSDSKKKACHRRLLFSEDFESWLYWLLVSLSKHSTCRFDDDKLGALGRRKGKLKARIGMKAFDDFHLSFVNVNETLTSQLDGHSHLPQRPSGVYTKGVMNPTKERISKRLPAHLKKRLQKQAVGLTGEGGLRTTKLDFSKLIGSGNQASVVGVDRLDPARGPVPIVVKTAQIHMLLLDVPGGSVDAVDLIREARVLAALGEHAHIIRMFDAKATKDRVYIFMEQALNDMKDWAADRAGQGNRIPPKLIRRVACDILDALIHMHDRKVFHMDIKADNVMMFPHDRPKLADLGLAACHALDGKKLCLEYTQGTGSKGYIPPECWDFHYPDEYFTQWDHIEKYDAYSTGRMFLRTLLGANYRWGYTPLTKDFYVQEDVAREIQYWNTTIRARNNATQLSRDGLAQFADICLRMIDPQRDQRMSVRDALKALQRDFKDKAAGPMARRRQKMLGGRRDVEALRQLRKNRKQ